MPIYLLVPIDPTDIAWGVKAASQRVEAPSEDAARERAAAQTLRRLRSHRHGRVPAHLPWLYLTTSLCMIAAPPTA